MQRFLGSFAELRSAPVICVSVCLWLSALTQQLGSHRKDFYEIWNLIGFSKTQRKIQVLLNSVKNKGCFIRRPTQICDNVSQVSS